MAFPEGWSTDALIYRGPYPPPNGMRPLVAGNDALAVTSLLFSANAIVYRDIAGVDPQYRPDAEPHIWMRTLYVLNKGLNPIHISFDGVTVHRVLAAGQGYFFQKFPHAGFAVKRTAAGNSTLMYLAY